MGKGNDLQARFSPKQVIFWPGCTVISQPGHPLLMGKPRDLGVWQKISREPCQMGATGHHLLRRGLVQGGLGAASVLRAPPGLWDNSNWWQSCCLSPGKAEQGSGAMVPTWHLGEKVDAVTLKRKPLNKK